MIQQTQLRSFRCLFSVSASFLFTLYSVVVSVFILFIAAGTARHTSQQLRIALGLNLLYIILFNIVSRSQAARTANWNWLDEIRFKFHEFATRLKLSLLRLDTFICFASDSDSVSLSLCLSVCLSISRRCSRSRSRCRRRCRCRRPSLSDGCLNAASASSSFVLGKYANNA